MCHIFQTVEWLLRAATASSVIPQQSCKYCPSGMVYSLGFPSGSLVKYVKIVVALRREVSTVEARLESLEPWLGLTVFICFKNISRNVNIRNRNMLWHYTWCCSVETNARCDPERNISNLFWQDNFAKSCYLKWKWRGDGKTMEFVLPSDIFYTCFKLTQAPYLLH